MFASIKQKLYSLYAAVAEKFSPLFTAAVIDDSHLQALRKLLLEADTGTSTTEIIMENLKKNLSSRTLTDGPALKAALQDILITLMNKYPYSGYDNPLIFLVGVNGTGKTTTAGKLAHHFKTQGKRVLLVAADTFRAAAPEQLGQWAHRLDIPILSAPLGSDPAALVFKACQEYKAGTVDHIIIDTAGRLHSNENLMNELAKMRKVLNKQLPDVPCSTLITLDSMIGQASREQASTFKKSSEINGIILTKMDGTGKAGAVFGITEELNLPIAYVTAGEKIEAIDIFNATTFVQEIFS